VIDYRYSLTFFFKFLRGECVEAEVVEKARKEGRSEETKGRVERRRRGWKYVKGRQENGGYMWNMMRTENKL
jgi:hypothetical protein